MISNLNCNQNSYSITLKMKMNLTYLTLLATVLTIVSSSIVPHIPPIVSHVPKTYQINLDVSPQKRWAQIIHDYKAPLDKFMMEFDRLPIPQKFFEGVQFFAKNVYQHKDFVAEVDAVAKLSGYPFEKLFFINFMYEYSTACTGVLICTDQGKMIHGRNLDFSMWGFLSNLLIHAQFYKGGQKLFNSDLIVGSVIALTGSKAGAFSVNVDTRTAKNFDIDLISVIINNAIPTCWLVQKVLIQETTFDGAVKRLKSTRIGGPVYYIISGTKPYEGIVIERDVNSVHASYQLSPERWFLVQTNYDRDQPDPKKDERRIPAEKRLEQRGNKINEQDLMNEIMFQYPTFNIETIMSAIIVPSTGYHNTTAWYGANPATRISLE